MTPAERAILTPIEGAVDFALDTERERHPLRQIGFYVSVVDGSKRALLVGPFPDHTSAYAYVERTRTYAVSRNSWASFYGFGTARVVAASLPIGKLNAAILDGAA